MALEDSSKLEMVRQAFIGKLMSFETWADFKLFLQNVTKAQIKTFILNTLTQKEAIYTSRSADYSQTATNVGELSDELTSDM